MNRSSFFEGVYYRYQQYHNEIPVVGGGFTILIESDTPENISLPCQSCPGPSNPCQVISYLSANIFEEIKLDLNHNLSRQELTAFLSKQGYDYKSSELKITHNMTNECHYELVWEAEYIDEKKGHLIGWINANSEKLLYERTKHNFKNAPTADYGIRFMNDQEENNETILKNNRLKVHNFSPVFGDPGISQIADAGLLFSDTRIPTSPTSRDWEDTDASSEVFQAFWMADDILEVYQTELGIDLGLLNVGVHPNARGAVHFNIPSMPEGEFSIGIGVINEEPLVEYDIIGHEIAHAILTDNGIGSSTLNGGTLHEVISDFFGVYAESKLEGLDWVIGDNASDAAAEIGRDLQNTSASCFTDVQDETDIYARGEPLRHWFYICITGDQDNDITPMNLDEFMKLIVEVLPVVGAAPDYSDLMEKTIEFAETMYGSCSPQLLTIVKAWEEICVPTGHRLAEPYGLCSSLTGNGFTCEESNYIEICLTETSGLDLTAGKWTILGRNSTSFESYGDMQGNLQNGGSCLVVSYIPEMPYYPQRISVRYWNPGIGEPITKRVTINDCDGDDLTCEEYYGL